MKILFVWPNKESFNYKHIGLPLLSAIASNLGWERRLFDTSEIDFGSESYLSSAVEARLLKPVNSEKYGITKKKIDLNSRFTSVLNEYNPDLLAVTVLSTEALIAAEISKIAKAEKPGLPIIWGGKHPTLNPEKVLGSSYVDFVCVGEGLEAFPEFLFAFLKGKNLYNIANIWANKDGRITKNKVRPLKKNLDDLPYLDWDIFEKRFFYKPFDGKVYIGGDHMLNWGCPYHCTYCINNFYHNIYNENYFMRRYSNRRIIEELKYLKNKYGIELFKFHDEDFLLRPLEGLKELARLYRQEINIPFAIETNPKSITTEKVKILKEMNCVSVGAAIETGDPVLRKNLLKRVDSEEDVVRAFGLLNEAGIRNSSFNMLGIPFETRETYERTIQLNRKANVHIPYLTYFYPLEGTELRRIAIDEGLFNPENEENDHVDLYKPSLHFDNLSEQELIQMRNVFILYVKLPQYYKTYIKRSERNDGVGIRLRKRLFEIFDKTVYSNNNWFIEDGFKDKYIEELKEILNNYKTNR